MSAGLTSQGERTLQGSAFVHQSAMQQGLLSPHAIMTDPTHQLQNASCRILQARHEVRRLSRP